MGVTPKIAPSMLSSDFANLASEAHRMINSGADWLHMDIMMARKGLSAHMMTSFVALVEGYRMIGSFLTWALVSVFGYAYPAYECYKVVEKNKPEIEQLRFWCQYWILVAVMTVCERFGDTFVSWVPMYCEAKLAFFIFLWYPKTKGTTYVYDSFFRPYVAKPEPEIDRSLSELRTRAGDYVVLYSRRAVSYSQTRIYDILKFVSAQSTPAPQPAQQRPGPGVRLRKPAPAKGQPAAATEPQVEEPPSPASSTTSSQFQKEVKEELLDSPQAPKVAPPVAGLNKQKSSVAALNNQKPPVAGLTTKKSSVAGLITQKSNPSSETIIISSSSTESEPKNIESTATSSSSASENGSENGKSLIKEETRMEESIRVTRGRLRKTRSVGTQ